MHFLPLAVSNSVILTSENSFLTRIYTNFKNDFVVNFSAQ